MDLSYTRVTDAGLVHLQRFADLEELHIAGTGITDAGLEDLKKLKNLRRINADRSLISRNGQLELVKFLAPRARADAIKRGSRGPRSVHAYRAI